jgi:hypothetical protein
MRTVSVLAAVIGAVGSTGLMLVSGQHPPVFIVLLFVIWNTAPFAALAWGAMVSQRWSVLTRSTLYGVTLIVTVTSIALYLCRVLYPPESTPAFIFVAVPLGAWLLMAIAVPIAALVSSRRSLP